MRLVSNKVNKDFETFSNEATKLSISSIVAYGVLSSAQFAISMLFAMKNKSARKMLNKRGPIIDPWGTTQNNFHPCTV